MVSVEFVGCEDVYDLSVEKYHNFAVNNVFVHNCFALPIEDDISAIFEAVKQSAIIHKSGGGTGFSFSKIRPSGSVVKSTSGVASGPISFMKVFNAATEVVKQGGKRRGANLGVLVCNHPDIIKWINCKTVSGMFENFNISVSLTDDFLKAAIARESYDLIDPCKKTNGDKLNAGEVLDLICNNAWLIGEPGVLFIDTINRMNSTPHLGKMETTNPCVSGDTLVMIAGESPKPIKDLVGKEFPVYCVNHSGNLVVRKAFNVRKTRTNQKLFRVLLDDGSIIEATEDHTFINSDNEKVLLKDLKYGDSLMRFDRKVVEWHRGKYWRVARKGHGWIPEHRHLAEYYSDRKMNRGEVVHHIDFDGLNNKQDNLVIVSKEKHREIHDISGDRNPMIRFPEKNWMNDFVKQQEMRLRNHVGKKRSSEVCKNISNAVQNAYDTDLDIRSRVSIGTKIGMHNNWGHFEAGIAKRAKEKLIDYQSRTDLECLLVDNRVYVKKYCAGCGIEMIRLWGQREIRYCNIGCWNRILNTKEYRLKIRQQEAFCNHKVISIEFVRIEDVYDLTVEEFLNYAIVTSQTVNSQSGLIIWDCGETPLYSWESCNLGSIDLAKFVKDDDFQWTRLEKTLRLCVRFMDDVIDVNKYPKARIENKTKLTRKIGLGVMGWADALIELNIKYDSVEALNMADKVMKFMKEISHDESHRLAKERGVYPASIKGAKVMRNATLTTIAPTGTLSLLADCSSGIEPIFDKSYTKTVMDDVVLDLSRKYTYPEAIRTAHEISPENHVRMQAAFQRHCDNAVSKTINLPHDATVEDVKKALMLSYELGCKGVTFYRDGTRDAPLKKKDINKEKDKGLSECENGKCDIF